MFCTIQSAELFGNAVENVSVQPVIVAAEVTRPDVLVEPVAKTPSPHELGVGAPATLMFTNCAFDAFPILIIPAPLRVTFVSMPLSGFNAVDDQATPAAESRYRLLPIT